MIIFQFGFSVFQVDTCVGNSQTKINMELSKTRCGSYNTIQKWKISNAHLVIEISTITMEYN